jgi:hypothetical protein
MNVQLENTHQTTIKDLVHYVLLENFRTKLVNSRVPLVPQERYLFQTGHQSVKNVQLEVILLRAIQWSAPNVPKVTKLQVLAPQRVQFAPLASLFHQDRLNALLVQLVISQTHLGLLQQVAMLVIMKGSIITRDFLSVIIALKAQWEQRQANLCVLNAPQDFINHSRGCLSVLTVRQEDTLMLPRAAAVIYVPVEGSAWRMQFLAVFAHWVRFLQVPVCRLASIVTKIIIRLKKDFRSVKLVQFQRFLQRQQSLLQNAIVLLITMEVRFWIKNARNASIVQQCYVHVTQLESPSERDISGDLQSHCKLTNVFLLKLVWRPILKMEHNAQIFTLDFVVANAFH